MTKRVSDFIFATGIENSSPVIRMNDGHFQRVDQFASCGHYENWEKDFDLVLELGISHLRYGVPYYKVHLGPDLYDWSFSDKVYSRLREKGITPIVDLCHFGVPDWIGNFQSSQFSEYFPEYARVFALRYPWIKWYTPINEIFITATFSAQYGWWNECLSSDQAFVSAITNICKANVLSMKAILEVRPSAIFVQSESTEYFHASGPDCIPQANFLNSKRFIALDLTYGHDVDATVYRYLMKNGLPEETYQWFFDNQQKSYCIMGNDYYFTNEHFVHPDGSHSGSGEIFGYYVITKQYYDRYLLPVMHTETNFSDRNKGVAWLHKEWANVLRLRQDGVPILGFTWYSLTDQYDWDSALREVNGHVNPLGLFDLDRKIQPVGVAYKEIIKNWSPVLGLGNTGLPICPPGCSGSS